MSERRNAPHVDAKARPREDARLQGYTCESCGQCGNFTPTRNGTCLKSATCGATKDARDVIDLRSFVSHEHDSHNSDYGTISISYKDSGRRLGSQSFIARHKAEPGSEDELAI